MKPSFLTLVLVLVVQELAGGGEGKGDGVYEKDVATHGDVFLHKFKKRITRSPQQVMR